MRKFKVTIQDSEYAVAVEEVTEGCIGATGRNNICTSSSPASAPVRTLTPVKPTPVKINKNNGLVNVPIPGIIISILVQVGDNVKKGDVIMILEAMKLENEITATKDGKVAAINVIEGQSVNTDEIVLVIE
ncbi:biotin/lipoyl-containing protein [Desulfotomaculum copahuensis]|uniref:Biotin carboxyl carrier protein of acetyl-CoA carboxylase n=1 Tax=Desulfotomaculum copahuensis TaxID=1838280 RepID=A0A1B7LEH2_9FIRM|nr:biotin/lipoyl-containing protein [Desulfotomaculum copahuensis]OAT81685.1 hypothetical protein A6M21_09735 [Desulfotomaculum copahuensis]